MTTMLIGSMFRDSMAYLPQYLLQQEVLGGLLAERGITPRWVLVEGDSIDETRQTLCGWAHGRRAEVVVRADGAPYYPSADLPERWAKLAWVANATLEAITLGDTYYAWIESDLRFDPRTIVRLVEAVERDRPIVAPLLMGRDGETFYDIHGTSAWGVRFGKWPPYHPALEEDPQFLSADSSGGVCVMWADVAAKARNTPEAGYVGFAKSLVSQGYPWTLMPRERVFHT